MTNLERLNTYLNNKNYFTDEAHSQTVYQEILEENHLDPFETYEKANDQINMLESVYSILQMLANDVMMFIRVETEFTTVTAAYSYLQKRLEDLRKEIDRVKLSTSYRDESGNVSSMVTYLFYNS